MRFDEDDAPVEVVPFAEGLGPLVDLQAHPHTGQLWMLDIEGSLARIRYVYGDLPPTAEGEAAPHYGAEPLLVEFSAEHSSDPEGLPLGHAWDFGDGLQSSLEEPRHVFPSLDVTTQGTPISLALSLNPPQSTSAPGYDPAVIQDGVYAKGGAVLDLQYLTQHDFPSLKLGVDWVGYEFPSEHSFHGLDWQEGMEFGALGGWFDAPPTVQVRTAGVWSDVSGLSLQPAYAGQDGQAQTRHELLFLPRVGDAIRLYGDPGGTLEFFSTVELRVLAAPPTPLAAPTRYDVQLAVTDAAGNVDQVVVPIYVNDTPPVVSMVSPAQGISYDPHLSVSLPLDSVLQDAEHTLAELDASWHVMLHHNQHEHPEPVIQGQSASYELHPHNELPGEVIFYSVRLDVADPLGLATSVTHYLWPRDDCNLNGYDDALDIASGASLDIDQNGVPDECQLDCDGSGLQDPFDLHLGLAQDCNQNGVPDSCDIASGTSLDVDANGIPDECP